MTAQQTTEQPPYGSPWTPPVQESLGDEELAAAFVRGDELALAAAYHRWGRLVYTLARRSLGDAAEAEDVSQVVFLAAWRGRAGYAPERGALAAWFVGITRRKIADALSARTRRADLVAAAGAVMALRTHDRSGEPDAVLDRVLVGHELSKLPRRSGGCSASPSTTTSPRPRSPRSPACRWERSRVTPAAGCTA